MSDDDASLICPITQEIFRDPVIAEDGRLYEREAITRWINQNGTSPFTRQALNIDHLQPDEHVRKRADRKRRRRLSVVYNRQSDQVELPPIRSTRDIQFDTIITDIEYPHGSTHRNASCQDTRCRCPTCSLWKRPNIFACLCVTPYVLIPILVIVIIFSTSQKPQATFSSMSYSTLPPACYALNPTLTINSCITSFTNVAYVKSGICNAFTYQRITHTFIASSSTTTIIFAFQQTFGYWDIDNITLWDYSTNQNIFQNGDFESGSLLPDYSRCQSVGYISNSTQFNGQYCYSDRTNGQFGYLMQNVSTTVGSRYYLRFYLQNRNGSGGSYIVLLGT